MTPDGRHPDGTSPSRSNEEVPDFVEARDHVRKELVRFTRTLRRAGADVSSNAAVMGARALVHVGFSEGEARTALRAALLTRRDDIGTFDRLFPEFWQRLMAGLEATGRTGRREEDSPSVGLATLEGRPTSGDDSDNVVSPDGDAEGDAIQSVVRPEEANPDDESETSETATTATYSPTGSPALVDVDTATVVGGGDIGAALRELTRAIAGLAGRRWDRRDGPRVDTRRALRESFSTGGIIVSVPTKDRKLTAVRCLFLVDVSQSVLDTIDRGFLLGFLRGAHTRWRDTQVFFFDDSVREVTEQFDSPSATEALAALERAETEWGGGTRIGNAVATIRHDYPNTVDRKTVVFVVSDGLELGEVNLLEREMAWLSRRSSTVLWLNPLAASVEYEPSVRGMAAALPYIDGLFAFTGPDDVVELARQLQLRGPGGTLGYEQDPRRRGNG